MTRKDKVRIIKRLVRAYNELERRFKAAEALFGCDPETPFQKTMYTTLLGGYVDAVSELVGDQSDWVNWYIWDNNCGARAGKVSWTENGKPVEIEVRTVADLVKVIEGMAT